MSLPPHRLRLAELGPPAASLLAEVPGAEEPASPRPCLGDPGGVGAAALRAAEVEKAREWPRGAAGPGRGSEGTAGPREEKPAGRPRDSPPRPDSPEPPEHAAGLRETKGGGCTDRRGAHGRAEAREPEAAGAGGAAGREERRRARLSTRGPRERTRSPPRRAARAPRAPQEPLARTGRAAWAAAGARPPRLAALRPPEPARWGCGVRRVWAANRARDGVTSHYHAEREKGERAAGKAGWPQLLEVGVFGEGDVDDAGSREERPGRLAGADAVRLVASDTGDALQATRCATQTTLHLSHVFESFVPEMYFPEQISENKSTSSVPAWSEISARSRRAGVGAVTGRSGTGARQREVLGARSRARVPGPLTGTRKAVVCRSFDPLSRIKTDCKSEEECVFKWIVYLNYPKSIIVENHTVYLVKVSAFSRMLEENIKPMLKKRRLLETEHAFEVCEKENTNSFTMAAPNTHFPIFDTYEKIPLMDFDDMDEISLTKEFIYKNENCPEQVVNVENLAHFSPITVQTNANSYPQLTQTSQRHMNEKFYDINMYQQVLDTKRTQEHGKICSLNSKCVCEDCFSAQQQASQTSHDTRHNGQSATPSRGPMLDFRTLPTDIKERKQGLFLKEEIKITTQRLANSHKAHTDVKTEKEEEGSFSSRDSVFSIQSVSLTSKTLDMEDAVQKNQTCVNQNNIVDRNEYESVLQESELANSKHFDPKNDSTECLNHHLETDLSAGNNDYFQDLTAKCLPTEALTIAKDFEMKSEFDLVLEELRMFHEISEDKEMLSGVKTNNGQENHFGESNDGLLKKEAKKDLKMGPVHQKCASSLLCGPRAGPAMRKRQRRCFPWRPGPPCPGQALPLGHCHPGAAQQLAHAPCAQDCEKSLPQRYVLFSDKFKEEKLNYSLNTGSSFSHGISRVHPLKTCNRPIRIGLSRKAKLKQLHPYLK